MVTWLPPHNITDTDAVKEYSLSWTKMPIMSKQMSEPHSESTTLPPVSFAREFFSLLNYLILPGSRGLLSARYNKKLQRNKSQTRSQNNLSLNVSRACISVVLSGRTKPREVSYLSCRSSPIPPCTNGET